MADGGFVLLEGFEELDQALSELSDASAKAALYKVLFEAAAPMDAAWRDRAPVGPVNHGKHPHKHLRSTGGVAKSTAAIGNEAFYIARSTGSSAEEAVVAKRDALRDSADERSYAEVTIGPGRAPQALWSEFGTSRQGAKPYFRPAWDATKDQALSIIQDRLAEVVDKTVERARKRTARREAQIRALFSGGSGG